MTSVATFRTWEWDRHGNTPSSGGPGNTGSATSVLCSHESIPPSEVVATVAEHADSDCHGPDRPGLPHHHRPSESVCSTAASGDVAIGTTAAPCANHPDQHVTDIPKDVRDFPPQCSKPFNQLGDTVRSTRRSCGAVWDAALVRLASRCYACVRDDMQHFCNFIS